MGDSCDLAQTDRLLTTTRAVRKRLDLTRPVPRELILDCIRVATQAPAGGHVQRWHRLVIDDPSLKSQLAELYRRAYHPYMTAQREAVQQTGRTGMDAILDSSDHLAEARAVLGIPDTVTQVALTPVAYFTGDGFRPADRRPAEEITYFNGWKS